MPLFLISEGDAISVALLAGLFYLIAIILFLVGLAMLKKNSKQGLQLLIIAFVLFIIGTGVCGISNLLL